MLFPQKREEICVERRVEHWLVTATENDLRATTRLRLLP